MDNPIQRKRKAASIGTEDEILVRNSEPSTRVPPTQPTNLASGGDDLYDMLFSSDDESDDDTLGVSKKKKCTIPSDAAAKPWKSHMTPAPVNHVPETIPKISALPQFTDHRNGYVFAISSSIFLSVTSILTFILLYMVQGYDCGDTSVAIRETMERCI